MNLWPNGEPITTEQLVEIALDNKLITPLDLEKLSGANHGETMFHSKMSQITMQKRFEMWQRNELILRTTVREGGEPKCPEWLESLPRSVT